MTTAHTFPSLNTTKNSETNTVFDAETTEQLKSKVKNSDLKRMTIALPPESAKLVELLSGLQDVSQIEAIKRAISTEAFIQREVKKGSRILVQTSDDQIKELVFR